MFNVNLSTLWRWLKSGYLKTIEFGGGRRYKMSEIKEILNGNQKMKYLIDSYIPTLAANTEDLLNVNLNTKPKCIFQSFWAEINRNNLSMTILVVVPSPQSLNFFLKNLSKYL